jgi:Lon protease-like protein
MSDDPQSLSDFSGVVRLFPLPNLVMFPSVVQPLHIFEARYRAMMMDALDDDRLLAMALLRPGWEDEYEERPAIHPVACLGRIFNEERLSDGRWNLLLHGLHRVRIDEELPPSRPYRQARVTLLEDIPGDGDEQQLRNALRQSVPRFLDEQGGAASEARRLLDSDLSLGTLCDVFSYALPIEQALKQQLLQELDITRRTVQLLDMVHQFNPSDSAKPRAFPPDFSAN